MHRLRSLFVLSLLLATACSQPEEKPAYYLGVLNDTGAPVTVTVSLDGGTHEVQPGQAASFRVADQDPTKDGAEREFRITSQGKDEVVKSSVKYDAYPVLDVSGQGCYALVDYYGAYTEAGLSVTPDVLKVKAIVRKQRFQNLAASSVAAGLGDPLPEKVYQRADAPGFEVNRIVAIPCELAEDEAALKAWLASH